MRIIRNASTLIIIPVIVLSFLSCKNERHLPQEALAQYINGKLSYENGNLNKAYQEFIDLSNKHTNFREAYLMAAKSAYFLGEYPEAEKILSKIWEKYPDYYDSGYWLGRALLIQEKNEEALDVFIILNKNNPNDFRVLQQLALISMEKEDLLASMDYCKQALLLRDEMAQIALTLAQIYYSQGLLDEAYNVLKENKGIATNDSTIYATFEDVMENISK
ncbi:MAG: tetratricopeptide repeat protein [Spirochaetales bacterium]|nr:tetratricopeptide repeat protein [Spirochaetales bacterium]